jgi:hypothetical protein
METQNQQQTTEASGQNPELTIVDLQNIKAIIEVCARRGAFQANEMAAIGTVFNKLGTFLEAVAPQQSEETTPAEQPSA